MPRANTYRVERLLGPYGFSVTDVLVAEGNRKRPVTFKTIGETIDLNKVDIKTFVKSSMTGQLRNLLVGGAISTVQQEISDAREKEIQETLAEYGVPAYTDHLYAAPVKYVELEPGVMVAVAQGKEPPKQIEVIQPPAQPMTAEIEPGITAPTGAAGGATPETLTEEQEESKPEAEKPKKPAKKKAKAEALVEPATASDQGPKKSQYEDWKLNLDFQAQKRKIVESVDADFLKWVAANDDSVQFQKLAQNRLAES